MTDPGSPIVGLPPPRANPKLIGQDDAMTAFATATGGARLAHAWLLAGPAGIGKATLAYRAAREVLGATHEPADPIFRRIAGASHADLMVVDCGDGDAPGGGQGAEIPVARVRAIAPFLRLTAAEGGWRVVIVDGADRLNLHAANALLKLLEEPPNNTLMLLVCHRPSLLQATIRSRCRSLPLRPLATPTVTALLRQAALDLNDEALVALARLARGSIGRAVRLAADDAVSRYREIVAIANASGGDGDRLHALADSVSGPRAGSGFASLVELIQTIIQRTVERGARGGGEGEIVPGEGAAIRALLDRRDLARWVALWEKIGHRAALAERINLDRGQIVISALSGLAAPGRS